MRVGEYPRKCPPCWCRRCCCSPAAAGRARTSSISAVRVRRGPHPPPPQQRPATVPLHRLGHQRRPLRHRVLGRRPGPLVPTPLLSRLDRQGRTETAPLDDMAHPCPRCPQRPPPHRADPRRLANSRSDPRRLQPHRRALLTQPKLRTIPEDVSAETLQRAPHAGLTPRRAATGRDHTREDPELADT